MEAMAIDVVNVAPIPLSIKSARLKVTLLIVVEAITIMSNDTAYCVRTFTDTYDTSPIPEHPLT